mmetsp:Transcript_1396/g.1984  ORF Transcript_1396/g.1984 Transcript_1396/m.1984 type:complete len:276 (+) Transcript_1396:1160-1987(+)
MWQKCVGLFFAQGFARTVLVFGVAEATINSYCTFLNSLLVPRGFTKQFVSWMGILFITTCMIASGPSAYIVDLTRKYKGAVLICLCGLAFSIIGIVYAGASVAMTSLAILMTGVFVGPIQPVVMELAAQITYPAPEELMATVQQVAGNCMSVVMFLVIDAFHDPQLSMWGILSCVMVVTSVFMGFEGKLIRDHAEVNIPEKRARIESWQERYLAQHLPRKSSAGSELKRFAASPPVTGSLKCRNSRSGYGSLDSATTAKNLPYAAVASVELDSKV